MNGQMARDEAREVFARSGMTYAMLNVPLLRDLRKRMDLRMKAAGLIKGTFRMRRSCAFKPGDRFFAGLRCKSYYFEDREAVSFNPDGFIGFAGWADDQNIQPVVAGFKDWVAANA